MVGSMREPTTYFNEADKSNHLAALTSLINNFEIEKAAIEAVQRELDTARNTLKMGISSLLKDKLSDTKKYVGTNESKSNDYLNELNDDSQTYLKKFKTISGELKDRCGVISGQMRILNSDKQMVQQSIVLKD